MRGKTLWAVGLLVVALLFAANWGGRAQVRARRTWEYKVVEAQYGAMPPSVSERELNKLGEEGWELVGTRVVSFPQSGSTVYRTDYYFKRDR